MKKPIIKFKSLLQPIKDIEKRNEYFEYLSDEGKRLEIAWDMLQLLVSQIVKASGRLEHYWNPVLKEKAKDLKNGKEIQKYFCNDLTSCTVCARGGMMLSQIRLGNRVNYSWNVGAGSYETVRGFSLIDFENMEKEYEHNRYGHPYEPGTTEKLMNICCNILVNGNFNRDDNTDYLID